MQVPDHSLESKERSDMKRITTAVVALGAVAAFALAGCSNGSRGDTSGSGSTPSGAGTGTAAASQFPTFAAGATIGVSLPQKTSENWVLAEGLFNTQLTAAGFTKVTAANTTAASPTASTVFYGSDSLKATAELVAQTIKVSAVQLSPTDAQGGITVVLRSDPGA